jgi:metal transporter CNNM
MGLSLPLRGDYNQQPINNISIRSELNDGFTMNNSILLSNAIVWIGISFCITQSAIFSGLNLALFSISKLRLEVEAAGGNPDAVGLLALRKDSNLTLATVLWGNVTINVLLTLLSDSVLAGVGAFAFSTIVITLFGEIIPEAYFSRHALRMAARLAPLLKVYQVGLFPVAKPTAMLLNWWLGPEGITFLRERDFRALITKHVGAAGTEVGQLEAIGALNFLDLDDILVKDEGESIDPRSIITLSIENERPLLPKFERSPNDPFLQRLNASGRKWVIIVDPSGRPAFVLDAHHFLRDSLFDTMSGDPEIYWHRPIVVTDMRTQLGGVIGRMKVKPESPEDDVIDNDLILVWGSSLGSDRRDPVAHCFGNELRAIVGANMAGNAAQNEEIREHVNNIHRPQSTTDSDSDAFTCEFVDHVEHPVLPPIVSAILDEVIGPDVIGTLRPQTDTGTIIEPQPPSLPRFGCLVGTFSPSRRQIRSTRLKLTIQPAAHSIFVMRR